MYPEDRVLVGVINRQRDWRAARDEQWYRIPQARMEGGVNAEYLAFFLSGPFKERSGGIHFYAERTGVELAYRRDLLPDEAGHKRAGERYYKVALGPLVQKTPPVLNPTGRSISFIYTTWDRFVQARTIADLYSVSDYYVDRVYHALRDAGARPLRFWEAEGRDNGWPAHVKIPCAGGAVIASPQAGFGSVLLDAGQSDTTILKTIRAEIARQGGPLTTDIPLEGT